MLLNNPISRKMSNNCKKQGTLLKTTCKLLKASDLVEVSYKTGIPFYWLKRVADGKTSNPSVNRVQKVYEHLTNKKLIK